MQRLRLYDVMTSRMPALVGVCTDNVPAIANYVNSAQRRLLYAKEAGNEGWFGTWAEIAFNVSRSAPYITLPRDIARLQAVNICNQPVTVQNQWFEYLTFSNGRLPKNSYCGDGGVIQQVLSRNNVVTFTDMTNSPQYIVAYISDSQDVGKRTLIQGTDMDGNPIYSVDVFNNVTGTFLTFEYPSVSSTMVMSAVTGIQKDVTVGEVRYYQHDPNTGEEILLLTMQPSETTASYRRYYLHNLPDNCCHTGSETTLQVTAIAKLELIPCRVQTDYLLIQNLEAIIEECQSVRYSEMDTLVAKQMAAERHKQAIGLLNGEQAHYYGLDQAAVNFSPFGSARLTKQKIGTLI